MAKPWERDWSGKAAGSAEDGKKPWERNWGAAPAPAEPDASEGRSALDIARDVGVTALKAAVAVPEAAVGILDIPTGGRVGKALEEVGFRPGEAKKILDENYSPAQQKANAAVRAADGFFPTIEAALANPSVIATTAGESLGMMGAGGVVARGLMGAVPKMAAWAAGGLGEGVIGAGSAASSIRQETEDGLLTGKQSGAALASGAGTALLGMAGGKLAQKMGLPDVDTMIAQGGAQALKSPAGFVKAVVGGGISEGVFEELPQSIQEQMWQNYALDKPLTEGVGSAAALGLLTGAAMGGAGGGFSAGSASLLKDKEPAAVEPGGAPVKADEILDEVPTAPAAAAVAAVAKPTAAEEALSKPVRLTDLDRVQEIDQKLAELPPEDPEAATMAEERALLAASFPKVSPGVKTSFSTEAGVKVDGQYALAEAADLQTSHDANLRPNPAYPAELQPRDRTRAASETQIAGIVGKLDPARLGVSADAATGAPIIGADGLVESGNARTIALKRVYSAEGQKAQDYKNYLRENAAQFGLTAEQIDGMQAPVLVRVRTTPVNRAEFARQANASTVAQMSPSEQAKTDASRIDVLDDLTPDEQGDFATSRDFIRRFVGRLPATEQGGMIDAGGRLSSSGYARVRNAVLAKAYGDSPILTRMVESMDDNLRNVSKALLIASPRVAQARALIKDGRLHDADVTPHLISAVEELGSLKERGTSVADALAQVGIEGDAYTPETRQFIEFLSENMRKPRKIAEFVTSYFDALEAMGDPNQASMFDDTPTPTTGDLMGAARRATQGAEDVNATQNAGGRLDSQTAQGGVGNGEQPAPAPGDGRGNEGDGQPTQVAANDAPVDGDWRMFDEASGTLGIPRAEMPQVKVNRRPALYEFLVDRGITNKRERVSAGSLKPTQAEYSRDKSDRAAELLDEDSDRQIVLASSDNYVLDGHHRWVAAQEAGRDVEIVRLDAPIKKLLEEVPQFPGATTSSESAGQTPLDPRQAAVQDLKDGLADLAMILTKHQRAAMVPENTPGLMPTLVTITGAAIKIVGTDLRRVVAWVRDAMKADPKLKPLAAKIDSATIRKAAAQALDDMQKQGAAQASLFDEVPAAADVVQGDLFSAAPAAPSVAMINGRPYDRANDNYKPPLSADIISPEVMARADALVAKYFSEESAPVEPISKADRTKAEGLLQPMLAKANDAKVAFDQKIIDIAKGIKAEGQMLGNVKGIKRSAEKLAVDYNFDTSKLRDLLRATLIVSSYEDAQAALEAIGRQFKVQRVKNKTDIDLNAPGLVVEKSPDGYQDILINVVTANGTVAEIQINTPAMMAAKKSPGHKLYEVSRAAPEGSPEATESRAIQRELYAEALAAAKNSASVMADQRPGQDLAGAKPFQGAFSSSEKTLPSGNLTKDSSTPSPSVKSIPNLQPGGNDSGTFIATSTAKSVPSVSGNDADVNGQKGAKNVNTATDGRNGAEGAAAGAARQSEGKRPAQKVRTGPGGSDLFAGGEPDVGAASQGEMGQPGRDGVRSKDADGGSPQPRGTARRGAGVPAGRDIAPKSGLNYRMTDADLSYEGSWFKKAEQNVDALELLKKLQAENRQATRDEQSVLAKWIGWGAGEIANKVFSPKSDKQAEAYNEYAEVLAALKTNPAGIPPSDPVYTKVWGKAAYQQGKSTLRYRDAIPADRLTPRFFGLESDDIRWLAMRERIKAAMTADEWAEARRSTQYAHFTSKGIVRSMWSALERFGFKGGTMLEPGAGNGIFPGLMPEAMAINSSYTGIEYDSITGGILKQLQPDERILIESFVESKLPKNFFDVGVGNPPFSPSKILSDPEYRKNAFSLHDYFFAKTMDRVKPGGLVTFVTSRYTMDKQGDKARQYLAERADLVGAIRLPQTAFQKNAGTEVVTDVLFLRKKVPGEQFEYAKDWLKAVTTQTKDGPAIVNEYFAANPDMVLGTPALQGSMYSANEYTVLPPEGDIEELFAKAVEKMPANIYRAERGSAAEAAQVRELDFNPKAQKEGNYYVNDKGVLMQREGGVGQAVLGKKPADVEIIKAFVPLRDALKQAHYDQLNDGDWEKSLAALRKEYDKFVKAHGRVNQFIEKTVKVKADELDDDGQPTGRKIDDEEVRRTYPLQAKLQDDPDWTLAFALEKVNDDTGAITESAFLNARVLGKPEPAQIQSAHDALLSVLNDMGEVNMPAIAQRLSIEESDAAEALGSAVYQQPDGKWTTADDYLSGNVKRKLEEARIAAKADRRFERNVKALEDAQPAPKSPAQISAGIGMNWIPGSDYAQFLKETAGVGSSIVWNEATRQWSVTHNSGYSTTRASADWGTGSRHAGELLEHALTGRPIRITKTVGSGKDKTTVFDADATEAANAKLTTLKEEFERWLWKDAERSDRLVQIYNDRFNTTVPRAFDGRHLSLPGASKQFNIFDHVKRGAWRIVQSGNTYLAHAVGSGKTFQMVISAMEQKRLGLIKKPMMVVPNHMLQQFAREWQELYPAARLMVADEANFHTDNRKRFVSRVALSDLDGVIITHSAFKLLDLDPEFKQKIIEEQLEYMRAALEEVEGEDKRSPRVKQIERQIENLEEKLKAALSGVGKDKNVRFDELGVDQLYVDEAHEFRKLDFATSRQVKGIQPAGSQRALDLYIKSRYLEEKKPGRSLVLASGTPVTNTLAEIYTVQRFMGRQALIERGLEDFDSWAAMFGREKTELEPDASGKYAPVTRFSKFVNVPELTQMFREFADVVTSDQLASLLGDKRPKVEGGSRNLVVTPKSAEYTVYQKQLAARVEASRRWKPSKAEPNNPDPMVKIIGDGRLAAIDMRFVNPISQSDPGSKLNRMIDDVIAKFKETADLEYQDKAGAIEPNKGSAMMVFSDLGFGAGVAESRGFNARAWFEKRMRDAGIPMNQVAFMSDYKKSTDKLKLFRDVNAGRVRVLVGSSKNMGTGVNAQQRLKAMFHLDSPWYPADLEQREGRIIRQGNKNKLVQIFAYAAKGTYDENMWKMLASKQFFIDQALAGDENLREIEDLSSQSQYDLAAALVAEDPRVIQLAGAKAEVEKLGRLYRAHEDQRMKFREEFRWAEDTAAYNEKMLPEAIAAAESAPDLSGESFKAKADGKSFDERVKWGEAILAKNKELSDAMQPSQTLGEIGGFKVRFESRKTDSSFTSSIVLMTPEPSHLMHGASGSPIGIAMSAQNSITEIKRKPARMRQIIEQARAKADGVRERLSTPFPMAELMSSKIKEAQELERELQDRDWYVQTPDGKEIAVKANGAQQAIDKIKATNPGLADAELTAKEAKSTDDPFGTKLSRGSAGGIAMKDLKAVAAAVADRLPGLPPVKVLQSPQDAPEALRRYIEARGAMADVEGALHDGKIYLFASGLADAGRAEHVLAEHEAAHAGLRGLLGSGVSKAMLSIYNQNAGLRRQVKALQSANPGLPLAEAVEEVIVDIPTPQLAKLTGWRGFVAKVRDMLKGRGFEKLAAMLDNMLQGHTTAQQRADLMVADLVREARAFVKRKPGSMAGATALSDGKLSEDLAKQEAWLTREAKVRGFKDIEDMLEKDYPLFEKLAALWREKNPASALLSRAYHGSPYKGIDKFSTDKIGTGEGAQAFGWGLYFASKKEVAKWYKNKLTGVDGKPLVMDDSSLIPRQVGKSVLDALDQIDREIKIRKTNIAGASGNEDVIPAKQVAAWKAELKAYETRRADVEKAGQLYEVEIPEDSEMLLWDKPLTEQPEKVREALSGLAKLLGPGPDQNLIGKLLRGEKLAAYEVDWAPSHGQQFYKMLSDRMKKPEPKPSWTSVSVDTENRSWSGEKAASQALMAAGVKGIKYPDGMSRDGDKLDGSFNYVIFSGDDVAITARLSRAGQDPAAPTAAERAEGIIQKAASSPRPLDAISRGITRGIGLERFTTMLYGKGAVLLDRLVPEKVKAGIVSDYGVPEAVIDKRARMQGVQREQLRQAGTLVDKLASLTRAESRVAYEWMSGDDTRAADEIMKDLPEESVKVLQEVKVMIDDLSREAVRLGQLEPDAFERNRFAYLRRSYFKHEKLDADNSLMTPSDRAAKGRSISILGDQYKGRGMVLKAPMKQIQNVAPEWWKRKFIEGKADTSLKGEQFLRLERRVARDAATADLEGFDPDKRKTKLAEVVYWPAGEAVPTKYSEWEKAGTWEVRNTKAGDLILWRDFTKEERTKMGEIDEARYAIGKTLHRMIHDIEVGRYLEWLSQNHAKLPGDTIPGKVVEASERYRDAFSPGEWVQVPDVSIPGTSAKKYGKLAGQYLPGPIWNDLRQVVNGRIMPLGETYSTLLRWWKTSKALALDTPIPTPSGWTTMGEIKVGDPVFDEAGNVCHVMGATPVQLDRVCYEVAFSDGEKIVADAEHMWFTIMRGKSGVRTTEEILATLKEGTRGDANHHVPVAGALDLYDVPVPVHPYVLGAWLGDGDSNAARITQGERDAPQIIAHLEAAGVKCAQPSRDRRSSAMTFQVRRGEDGCTRGHGPSFMTARGDCRECANLSERLKRRGEFLPVGQHPSIQVRLREMNLFGNKHIPAAYLRGSEEQRRELLMGLMDTDGHITKRGECAFTTTIPQLRDGVVELLRSLGYKPSCFEWQPACKGKPGKIAWRISFKAYADKPVFKLLRKRDRLHPMPAKAQRSQTRSIVAITPVKSVPVRCIAVSSESRLYLAGRGMIPTHNTALSPGVHTNNIMSNFVMADWHDVNATHVAKSLRIILAARTGEGKGALGRAANAMGKAGIADKEAAEEIMTRYENSGGSIGGWVTQEIANEQLAPVIEALRKEINATAQTSAPTEIGIYSAMQHVLHARFPQAWEAFKGSRTAEVVATDAGNLIDLYQAEDDVFRLAAWLKAKEQGLDDAEAGKVSRKSFLDYQINAPWIAAMRASVLPFISFTYRAVPMLIEIAAKKPHKILKLMMLAGALNALGVMIAGGGDDDERKLLPDEKSGGLWGLVPKLIRMPWNDAHGSPVYLDVRRWVPVGDVFDIGQGQAAVPIPPSLMPGGPLAVFAEVIFNKSMFTGKPITLETDTGGEKLGKVLDHLYKAAMPNIIGLPNTYATEGVMGAAEGRTDAFGREMSVPMATASAMGVKLGAYPADVLRRNIIAKREAQVSEIDRQISQLKRQRQTNRIDADEFQEKTQAQQEKKAKVMREAAEKLR